MLNDLNAPRRPPFSLLLKTGVFLAVLAIVWLVLRPGPTLPLTEAPRSTLTLRDGRLYRAGESIPFSGLLTERFASGALQSRSVVSNGVLEGCSEGWYTNGQKQVEEHFHAGVSHGLRTKWYENGQKLSQASIVNGQIEGLFQRWHDNGLLAEEIVMHAGQPNGLSRAFYSGGCLKAEVTLSNGQVLTQHFWKDGEHVGKNQPN